MVRRVSCQGHEIYIFNALLSRLSLMLSQVIGSAGGAMLLWLSQLEKAVCMHLHVGNSSSNISELRINLTIMFKL